MSVCFHAHLFDSERFEAEVEALETDDDKAMLLVDCFVDDADVDKDFAGRYHPESGEYLGGVVDAVRAALPKKSPASRLLAHASCLEGRLSDTEPAFGYLTRTEVERLSKALEATPPFAVPGLEADRLQLLEMLVIARTKRRGLAFMTA